MPPGFSRGHNLQYCQLLMGHGVDILGPPQQLHIRVAPDDPGGRTRRIHQDTIKAGGCQGRRWSPGVACQQGRLQLQPLQVLGDFCKRISSSTSIATSSASSGCSSSR